MKKLIFIFIACVAIMSCTGNKVETGINSDSINTDTICDSLFYQE